MRKLRERKNLVLLAVLVIVGITEPLVVGWSERARIIAGVIAAVVSLGAMSVVFEKRWQRGLALFMLIVLFVSNIAHEAFWLPTQMAAVVFHGFAILYVGFAVAVILKRIFHEPAIRTDDVVGAVCGYLAAAIVWANAYALVYLLHSGSFHFAAAIASRVGDWHFQRFIFNYFSIMTLTTLGYGDVTPIGPLALSLSWLEAIFGQFYLAVVVAQLVGLRLAQTVRTDSSG
jgi:hypothetical protein